jgi:hypothetical protein
MTSSPPPEKERRRVFRKIAKSTYIRPLRAVWDHPTIPTAWWRPYWEKYRRSAYSKLASPNAGGSAYSFSFSLPYQPEAEQSVEPRTDTAATPARAEMATAHGWFAASLSWTLSQRTRMTTSQHQHFRDPQPVAKLDLAGTTSRFKRVKAQPGPRHQRMTATWKTQPTTATVYGLSFA